MEELTPELLLTAYANGYFPMADSRDETDLHWYHPEQRGILPLDDFHIPASLQKFLKHDPFTYTVNQSFREVITACATRDGGTWINDTIIGLYCELNRMGFAHSVECRKDGKLVGGLYGVALGGAFFGESMFSRTSNASKCALVHLVELLKQSGYVLLDTQFVNDHLKQFGVQEISREEYLKKLEAALPLTPEPAFRQAEP